jgi:hypothetical protein
MAKTILQMLADELEQTVLKRKALEASIEPVKEYEEQLRAKLIKELFMKGFQYIKTSSGSGFGIVSGRKTYTIAKGREQEAISWAQSHYPAVLSINKSDLAKVLKPMLTIPEFFEEKMGEAFLQVRASEAEE